MAQTSDIMQGSGIITLIMIMMVILLVN